MARTGDGRTAAAGSHRRDAVPSTRDARRRWNARLEKEVEELRENLVLTKKEYDAFRQYGESEAFLCLIERLESRLAVADSQQSDPAFPDENRKEQLAAMAVLNEVLDEIAETLTKPWAAIEKELPKQKDVEDDYGQYEY